MSDDKWAFPDSRVSGVKEHNERIQTFLKLAGKSEDPVVIFRLQVAGIYFARGIIELILEACDKNQLSFSRDRLKKTLPDKLRWYNLIERIRIHDFHRFGLIPPNPNMKMLFLGGPIKVIARNGLAAYSIPPTGPKEEITGDSLINSQRPLISDDGRFFDEDTNTYVTLEQILKDFLCDVQKVIKEFEEDIG